MTDLSPAAQAVWATYLDHSEIDETPADLPALAAAIKTLADQVVPEENVDDADYHCLHAKWAAEGKQEVRDEILAIATELEGQSPELAPDSGYEKAAELFSKIMYSPAHPELRPTYDEGIHG